MRCSDIIEHLEQLAPPAYACEWDNPGLLAGRNGREVRRVMVALDATDEVVELAVREKAELLLTHHPLLFRPLKQVNDLNAGSARIVKLIQHDICCYAMHTNFDSAPGCMADMAAKRLKLLDPRPLEPLGVTGDGVAYGIGKVGELPEAMELKALAAFVKEAFSLPFVSVYGLEELKSPIRRAAVCPGSGKSMLSFARDSHAQVLISGDMGHHDGLDAVADQVAVIDGGHYGLEYMFVDFMDVFLRENFGGRLEVLKAPVRFPATII